MAEQQLPLRLTRPGGLDPVIEIGGSAVILRLIMVIASLSLFHVGFDQYAAFRDGTDYLQYAAAIRQLNLPGLSDFSARLYPGYSLTIAVFGLLLGNEVAGLLIAVLG